MARRTGSENQPLGLDEIMIVNPTPDRAARPAYYEQGPLSQPAQEAPLFLGDDGTLYGLFGPQDALQEGDLLLGQDGRFYRVTAQPASGGSMFIG